MDKKTWTNGIMGLVIGDACGVPVEFMSRSELKKNPVTNMREYGTHKQPRGTWSDDSSMALANLASLHTGYNLEDIAVQFLKWDMEEAYTPFGEVFDMGTTCNRAILNFIDNRDPRSCGLSGENDNGNGSLMRILPMCLYVYNLEAAIWSLLHAKSYEEAVLRAVNLGDDADTVGAVTGGLAGLYYGYDSIPDEWRNCIVQKEWIIKLCYFEPVERK